MGLVDAATPPTMAVSTNPTLIALIASFNAEKLDAHAESYVQHGPLNQKYFDASEKSSAH